MTGDDDSDSNAQRCIGYQVFTCRRTQGGLKIVRLIWSAAGQPSLFLCPSADARTSPHQHLPAPTLHDNGGSRPARAAPATGETRPKHASDALRRAGSIQTRLRERGHNHLSGLKSIQK